MCAGWRAGRGRHAPSRTLALGSIHTRPMHRALRQDRDPRGRRACAVQWVHTILNMHTQTCTRVTPGIVHCGKTVIGEEGVRALWKGLTPFATHLTLKYALRMGSNSVYQVRGIGGVAPWVFACMAVCVCLCVKCGGRNSDASLATMVHMRSNSVGQVRGVLGVCVCWGCIPHNPVQRAPTR